jgi:hypothetical protein
MNIFINISIYIILFVILLLIIRYIFRINKQGFKYNINNNKTDCDSHNCPVTKHQNDIYKLHVEFKPIRDKNHMLAHNRESCSFFNTTKGPENIFIIRHGEKIKSKTALDCNGILRSTYIPELIESLNKQDFGIHNIITAYDYNSMHQQQTVSLTSWLFSIPTFIYGDQTESEKAVKQLFTNKYFNGKTVLICWEHNCIQTLLSNIIEMGTKAKGLNNYVFKNPEGTSDLPYWDTNNYKSIYHLDGELNLKVREEKFTTCYPKDNNEIVYGKVQKCG